jgi:hypothetical protein
LLASNCHTAKRRGGDRWRVFGLIVFALGSVLPAFAQNTTIESFSKAKKLTAGIYAGHEQTFYCGCTYSEKTVDFASCGYVPKGKPETARRLEGVVNLLKTMAIPGKDIVRTNPPRVYAARTGVVTSRQIWNCVRSSCR